MSSQAAPRNRKERRAQIRQTGSSNDVPLARPKEQAPKGKTLIEIAQERQLLQRSSCDAPSVTTTQINPDGSITELLEPSDPTSTPYLDILLYSTSLIILHFTLTLLVHHQYASDRPSLHPLFLSSVVFSPTPWLILVLVATLHPRASHPLMQILFAGMAIIAGTWLVKASNDDPYLAVMKKAPALGTFTLTRTNPAIAMPFDLFKPSSSSSKSSSGTTPFPSILTTETLLALLTQWTNLSTVFEHTEASDIHQLLSERYGYKNISDYWTYLSLHFTLKEIDRVLHEWNRLPRPEKHIGYGERKALMKFAEKTQLRDQETREKEKAYVEGEERRKKIDKEGLKRIVDERLKRQPLNVKTVWTQGHPIVYYE
ncbi:MAG: hypothetical protein Q9220_005311 [cf. Caloplaca sp. 1 TL-2023]